MREGILIFLYFALKKEGVPTLIDMYSPSGIISVRIIFA